ncbi:hypothetical protein HAX54_019690 [Datura stramonium]|uniref:Uncharacterized protein n=1 Tax=Datura stramonium TaxID=4076 RepID=A0ABS8US31_DATST|nr:hypothetical protein [Datura stramonium]
MALPDDLKTKLSLDEDLVSSPKEALSRASADRVAWRSQNLRAKISVMVQGQTLDGGVGMGLDFPIRMQITERNLSKIDTDSRRFDDRNTDSAATLANQGAVTHLSEQISTLNDRMDDFTSRMEELNSKKWFLDRIHYAKFASSSFADSKGVHLMEELSNVARGQRQIMHQLDNLSNLLRYRVENNHALRRTHTRFPTISLRFDSVLLAPSSIAIADRRTAARRHPHRCTAARQAFRLPHFLSVLDFPAPLRMHWADADAEFSQIFV